MIINDPVKDIFFGGKKLWEASHSLFSIFPKTQESLRPIKMSITIYIEVDFSCLHGMPEPQNQTFKIWWQYFLKKVGSVFWKLLAFVSVPEKASVEKHSFLLILPKLSQVWSYSKK